MKKITILFSLLLNILLINSAQAEATTTENLTLNLLPQYNRVSEVKNSEYSIWLDAKTIEKGYTVEAFDELKLSLVPGILSSSTDVQILQLKEEFPLPWDLNKISEIYQFEFLNKEAYDDKKPFYIQFHYSEENNFFKQVYFYDKNFSAWRPLPTRDFPREKFVRSLIHLPFARLAVFSDPTVLTVGRASWYAHKNGNFAASPDFPKGSKIRVVALNSGKYVDVTINDYGPERNLFPDRVIDLDKIAYSKIAPLGSGVIDIAIEPLYIKPDNGGKVVGEGVKTTGVDVKISSKAAIVFNENTGEVLYNKNSTSTLPLASLTKLVAMKVFLDTRPTLDRVVEYKYQDEEYNYEWCKKWESARLRIDEGEKLTLEDLIYSSVVGSANNTVETLVRVSGLSREQFISKMNEEAKKAGAINTKFIEPTGLSPENVTTAYDYALITREVFKHPILEKASKMSKYSFTTRKNNIKKTIYNTNSMIRYSNYSTTYNLTGSKTGYLDEALYCLMLRARASNGDQIVVVSLGSPTKNESFDNTETLLKYGLRSL